MPRFSRFTDRVGRRPDIEPRRSCAREAVSCVVFSGSGVCRRSCRASQNTWSRVIATKCLGPNAIQCGIDRVCAIFAAVTGEAEQMRAIYTQVPLRSSGRPSTTLEA